MERSYGGCGILFRKSLLKNIKFLNLPFDHLCAISLNLHNQVILLVSVYFPTDYRSPSSDGDFLTTLGELEGFINSQSFDNMVIGGDFNVDFDKPSFRKSSLTTFMDDHNNVAVDTSFRSIVGYTYERDDGFPGILRMSYVLNMAVISQIITPFYLKYLLIVLWPLRTALHNL